MYFIFFLFAIFTAAKYVQKSIHYFQLRSGCSVLEWSIHQMQLLSFHFTRTAYFKPNGKNYTVWLKIIPISLSPPLPLLNDIFMILVFTKALWKTAYLEIKLSSTLWWQIQYIHFKYFKYWTGKNSKWKPNIFLPIETKYSVWVDFWACNDKDVKLTEY